MTKEMPIRLIASDVDGTLLNSRGEVTKETIAAIHDAQEKGIVFAISSGRFPENVYARLRPYGICCPIIGTNGARIADEQLRPIRTISMTRQAAQQVMDTLYAYGSSFFMFIQRGVCTSHADLPHHSEISRKEDMLSLGIQYFHGREEMLAHIHEPVQKFYICQGTQGDPLWQQLERIPGISLTQSGDTNIEVIPEGVDKASGVKMLSDHYSIPLSQVMTLGDHVNDIPMLSCAGYGVAMGNAHPKAKAAARLLTRSNDQEGLSYAIRHWALEEI